MKLIAKTFAGLEDLLAKELIELGADDVEKGIRMVSFTGDKAMLYKANFCLRTAVKILMPIREFKASDADEVYEEVKKIEWEKYMDVDNTFLVDAVVFSEDFRHSRFAAYRVKDAIADYFREKTGKRPNVGISNPDIRISLHIAEHDVSISLDSSGESLHHRGYRTGTVAAPLNEVLAAAIVMLTGWDGQSDFIDPMCGSGTILVEAALIARNIYPGIFRKEFAFEKWKDFDPDLFDAIYNDDSQEREFNHTIYGYDINHHAVAIAQDNAKSAGVNDIVKIAQQDVRDLEPQQMPMIMVTNPPYGERITTEDILGLYSDLGKTLKHSFAGGDAWILSLHEECFDKIGFRPSTRIILYNGALECELRKYQMFEGKLSERRQEGLDIKSAEDRERNLKFKGHKQKPENKKEEEQELTGEELYTQPSAVFKSGLGRRNFKWGDRRPGFEEDDDEHYFKARPFKNSDRKDKRDKAEDGEKRFDRKRDDKPFDRKRDDKPFDRKRGDKPFDRKRDDKPFNRKKSDKPFDRKKSDKPFDRKKSDKPFDRKKSDKPFSKRSDKPFDKKRSDKSNKTKRGGGRLTFDSEGNPIL